MSTIDVRSDAVEQSIMDLWRLAQTLTLAEPHDLAANLRGLLEAQDYLATAITTALAHKRKEAA